MLSLVLINYNDDTVAYVKPWDVAEGLLGWVNASNSTVSLSPMSQYWQYLFPYICIIHQLWFDRRRYVTHYEMDEPQAVPMLFCSPLFQSAPKPNSSSRLVGMGGWDLALSPISLSASTQRSCCFYNWKLGLVLKRTCFWTGVNCISFQSGNAAGDLFQSQWWLNTSNTRLKCLS